MARRSGSRKKNGFDTSVLADYAERLEAAGGDAAIKRAVTASLTVAKQEINKQVTAKMQPAKLPAGGKYSTGDTLASLDKTFTVTTIGTKLSMPLGFDEEKNGHVSAFLMYGTPRMKPVPGLNNAIKGKVARKTVRQAQEEAIKKILERLGE